MNGTSPPTNVRKAISRVLHLRLRDRLFLASSLLSTAILLIAALVINYQVLRQSRQQVRTVAESMLPVYNSVWDEHARHLASLGMSIAGSPSVKIIFGDERAARDRETIRQMIADFGGENVSRADLILITDGAGKITFAEKQRTESNAASNPQTASTPTVRELNAARTVAESQQPRQGFAMLGGKLYQLSLTPVLVQSAHAEYQNTLAVLGIGLEINRTVAGEIKERTGNDILFLSGTHICASSLESPQEAQAAQAILASELSRREISSPTEIDVNGQPGIASSRRLLDFEEKQIGQVVMLRSLAEAGRLFRSISNVLLLLWTVSIGAAFIFSYLMARRITRPIEALVTGTREYGRGNYDYEIKADVRGDLGELAGAFDQMRRSLKQTQSELLKRERLATIGQMAGSIVHDLRNPLATIATVAEMLTRSNLSPERRQTLLESQLRASQRMREMLQGLLDFSRGNTCLMLKRQSLSPIIENAVERLYDMALRSGVIVESRIADDLLVKADAEQLERVLENLLINSIQAMPKGGRLLIAAACLQESAPPAAVRIDIQDTGPGIAPEIRERIFEPFVSHGKPTGTGLGLAIARNIIHAHSGEIRFDASPYSAPSSVAEPLNALSGAHFMITLPLEVTGIHQSEKVTET
jgi:signal transduction histidine kinase